MKILLDQNISYKLIKHLQDYYDEIAQIGRLGMAQTDDAMIWQYARTHSFMVVTHDAYFSERNLISGNPIKVIWLRVKNTRTDNLARILQEYVDKIRDFSQHERISCLEIKEL